MTILHRIAAQQDQIRELPLFNGAEVLNTQYANGIPGCDPGSLRRATHDHLVEFDGRGNLRPSRALRSQRPLWPVKATGCPSASGLTSKWPRDCEASGIISARPHAPLRKLELPRVEIATRLGFQGHNCHGILAAKAVRRPQH